MAALICRRVQADTPVLTPTESSQKRTLALLRPQTDSRAPPVIQVAMASTASSLASWEQKILIFGSSRFSARRRAWLSRRAR